MKYRVVKKHLHRLARATATLDVYWFGTYFVPARKPMTGKSMRHLLGRYYITKELTFFVRPTSNERKYIFVNEDNNIGVVPADVNHAYRPGWQD